MRVIILFLWFPLTVFAQQPILVGNVEDPNEPSITLNRKNPQSVLCGANLNNLYISNDGGKSWERKKMTSKYGVWGDPVVISDSLGRYYYFHLSNPAQGNWIDRIVCQRSEDFGKTWTSGTYVGLNGSKAQDKHWAVFNENRKEIYLSWTQFDAYGSTSDTCQSNILFSSSKDYGQTWSAPTKINAAFGDCIDSSLTTEGAVPAFDSDNKVYVAWAGPNGIRLNKKNDKEWLKEPLLVDSNTAGWTLDIEGISRCNGMPVTAMDRTEGKYHDRLYVNWSDQRNGVLNTDVFLKYSDDFGKTWSSTKKLGRKKGKGHQFLTWMTLDQTSGILYFIFYDRSRYNDTRTDVLLARSYDGGETFKYKRIKQDPFVPQSNKFFGDYNNIDATDGIVQLVWTRMEAGQTSIWTYRFKENKFRLWRARSKMPQQK